VDPSHRADEHLYVGSISITRLSQLPKFSKSILLSKFLFASIIMFLKVYLAREIRFTKTIEILQSKKYIVIAKCVDVSKQTLNNK